MNHPRLWFGRKRLGWGWGPRSWEGWAIIGLLVAAAILAKQLL